MVNRATFGFKEVDGKFYKLKIIEAPRGKFLPGLALPSLRNYVVSSMNKYGRRAERVAKRPGWSPFLTGALVGSIYWQDAKKRGFTGLITGALVVGVPYGRRQEFEHRTRGLYLYRAIASQFPAFVADIQSKNVIEGIFFGRRIQLSVGKVVGGEF